MIRWTERAIADLVAIGEHIAADKPAAARRWVERLRHQAELVAEMPLGGRRVPEIGRDDVRETFLRSYRIVASTLTGSPYSRCSKGIACFARAMLTRKAESEGKGRLAARWCTDGVSTLRNDMLGTDAREGLFCLANGTRHPWPACQERLEEPGALKRFIDEEP